MKISRRDLMGLIGSGILAPPLVFSASDAIALKSPASDRNFKIRTITAGVTLAGPEDFVKLRSAVEFLTKAKARYTKAGYEVQTIRISTQPLPSYLPDWKNQAAIDTLQGLDQFALDHGVGFSLGPIITDNQYDEATPLWIQTLMKQTSQLNITTRTASAEDGIHDRTIRTTAEAISLIANDSAGGEGNFRFAATAFIPADTPFFPAAWHQGVDQFALGLETPNVLTDVFKSTSGFDHAKQKLMKRMNGIMLPLQQIAQQLSEHSGWFYTGMDTSPAPGITASIGEAIEALTESPFGTRNTLSACAAITDVLKNVDVKTCGYSGLMLPVMEDPVLAKRAQEGRFNVSELLLYSSVCGTGLDTVPLAGDVSVDALAAIIRDMSALATKYNKALSARLFPVPGASVGERVTFENPYLTDSVIMPLD
ncbi:MAG: hypothetical protein ACJAUG_003285 [Halioglobus sp.]|jgi:uncharacterized protein (UPF0210 family)